MGNERQDESRVIASPYPAPIPRSLKPGDGILISSFKYFVAGHMFQFLLSGDNHLPGYVAYTK